MVLWFSYARANLRKAELRTLRKEVMFDLVIQITHPPIDHTGTAANVHGMNRRVLRPRAMFVRIHRWQVGVAHREVRENVGAGDLVVEQVGADRERDGVSLRT